MPLQLQRKIKVGSVVPPIQYLINNDFETYSINNPMTIANFRDAVSDGTWTGGGQSNMTYLRTEDTGVGGKGKCITWTSPPNTFSTTYGLSITAIPIQAAPDWAFLDMWVRFRSGFEYSGGGKIPGLGGVCPTKINSAPTGGSPSPYGWSSRFMWLADMHGGNRVNNDQVLGYLYAPYMVAPNYGIERLCAVGFGGSGGFANGQWTRIRQVHKMNTAYVTSASTATPTVGVTHEADGIHEIWVDISDGNGLVRYYNKTNEVYRYYSDCHINRIVWSQFRGGATQTNWDSTTEGQFDIAHFSIAALAA